jgi:hypothetical protein
MLYRVTSYIKIINESRGVIKSDTFLGGLNDCQPQNNTVLCGDSYVLRTWVCEAQSARHEDLVALAFFTVPIPFRAKGTAAMHAQGEALPAFTCSFDKRDHGIQERICLWLIILQSIC